MAAIRDFRDLILWQRAMELACEVPGIIDRLPSRERYRLGDQLSRAVLSIPANIAEGSGRRSRADFIRFLAIANGSLREVQTFLHLIQRRDLADSEKVTAALLVAEEVGRMLTGLAKKLRNSK